MKKTLSPRKTALRSALKYIDENTICLDYEFHSDDGLNSTERDAFIEKHPRLDDLFNYAEFGPYYNQYGETIHYDFDVFYNHIDAIFNAVSEDEELMKEFFYLLCFDQNGVPRKFVRVTDDWIEFREAPRSCRDHDNLSVFIFDTDDYKSPAVCVNDDGVFLFWNDPENEN